MIAARERFGLWTLADMMNAKVTGLVEVSRQLMLMSLLWSNDVALDGAQYLDLPLSVNDQKDVEGWLEIIGSIADDFEMKAVHDRITVIRSKVEKGITAQEMGTEYRVLLETIEFGMKGHLIYRYPTDRNVILLKWQTNWGPTLRAFPSSATEINASVDLWAMRHPTAAVFHLMRVLEFGLKALAVDVGKTFDVQNWQNILDEIEKEIRAQSKSLPRGTDKSERLRFLSEAAKEFSFFKDGWRNHVMHNRATYDEHQAHSVMDHVRSFMNQLSSQLSEESES